MSTQKITMGRKKDTDYESKKRAALAQADASNSFMWGMQSVYANGTGAASKASRSPQYGNSNLVTGDMIDGSSGIFKPRQDPAGNRQRRCPRYRQKHRGCGAWLQQLRGH